MTEFTPTTDQVKNYYALGRKWVVTFVGDAPYEEFDRWLDGVKREARSQALQDAAAYLDDHEDPVIQQAAGVICTMDWEELNLQGASEQQSQSAPRPQYMIRAVRGSDGETVYTHKFDDLERVRHFVDRLAGLDVFEVAILKRFVTEWEEIE